MKEDIANETKLFDQLERKRNKQIEKDGKQDRYEHKQYNPDGSSKVSHSFYDSIHGLPARVKIFSKAID